MTRKTNRPKHHDKNTGHGNSSSPESARNGDVRALHNKKHPDSAVGRIQKTSGGRSHETTFAVRRELLVPVLLVIAILAVYVQVKNHDFINFDDDVYIYQNRHVLGTPTPENLQWAFSFNEASYWHPVTWLSLILDARFFGKNPVGYHLENVALHILNTLLLFYLLRSMTHSFWPSAFVAALFALHPMNVESIAWATERKNVLSTFFWMLTTLSYLKYAVRPGAARYFPIFFLFGIGLMAKTSIATLPAVLLLLDFWPLNRIAYLQTAQEVKSGKNPATYRTALRNTARLVLEKVPLFVLGAAIVLISSRSISKFHISTESVSLAHRIAVSFISYILYIGKMVWPAKLAVYYPYPASVPLWESVGAFFLILGMTAVVVKFARRAPYLAVGWLWFLGTLFPVIGLIQAGMWPFIADRFAYIPFIGLFIMLAWGINDIVHTWPRIRRAIPYAAVVVLGAFAITTWFQLRHWQNSGRLFRHTIDVTRNNSDAYLSLGAYMVSQNKVEEALTLFYEAVRLKPGNPEAHANLANLLIRQGKLDEARVHLDRAMQIRPDYAGAHSNMVDILIRQGRINDAHTHALEALRLKPDDPDAHNNLGVVFVSQGKSDEAIGQFNEAISLNPDNARAHYNLGTVLDGLGRRDDALTQLYEAVRLDPEYANPHYSLGRLFFREGKLDSALVHYTEAVRLNPDYAEAHDDLGNILLRSGRIDEALVQFNETLRLKPDYPDAHYNLGNIFARGGNLDSARVHYYRALSVQPDNPEVHTNLGNVFFSIGELDSARVHYTEALRFKPDYPEVHNNLGSVFVRMGMLNNAELHYREAIRLKPDYTEARNNLEHILSSKK
ncbi:tetratricopeptide repeat protein [bacterium]|nr:tetratricopeptide repeat protein [bacterium]